jgi:hypothetical protein
MELSLRNRVEAKTGRSTALELVRACHCAQADVFNAVTAKPGSFPLLCADQALQPDVTCWVGTLQQATHTCVSFTHQETRGRHCHSTRAGQATFTQPALSIACNSIFDVWSHGLSEAACQWLAKVQHGLLLPFQRILSNTR